MYRKPERPPTAREILQQERAERRSEREFQEGMREFVEYVFRRAHSIPLDEELNRSQKIQITKAFNNMMKARERSKQIYSNVF